MKDTDRIEIYDPIEKNGYNTTIGQLKEHLFGIKQEVKKGVPKKTEKKDEK